MATQSTGAKIENTMHKMGSTVASAGRAAKSKTGELFTKLKGSAPVAFMKAHPYQSAGLGILGGANVAGLFDNNKLFGQLGGAAAGALADIPIHALTGATGVNLAWAPMVGGAIGSLFDKAREAKDRSNRWMQANPEDAAWYNDIASNNYRQLKDPETAARFNRLTNDIIAYR